MSSEVSLFHSLGREEFIGLHTYLRYLTQFHLLMMLIGLEKRHWLLILSDI